jgi:hypothetical protein
VLDAEAFSAAHTVTSLLDTMGIRYVIGGSVASAVHGLVRTTMDVDIIADLEAENMGRFIAELELSGQFYLDADTIRDAVARRTSFNLIHLETMVKVDIFLPGDRPFDRQQLERRVAEQVIPDSDDALWVLTAEDVILAKLDWYRQGGGVSERQWRDVLGVIKTQGDRLDRDYLTRGAAQLNESELLERALHESGL